MQHEEAFTRHLASCAQLGILPTDTYPALVCDVDARKAVERLYAAKGMSPKKQLAILVRSFADINAYTQVPAERFHLRRS